MPSAALPRSGADPVVFDRVAAGPGPSTSTTETPSAGISFTIAPGELVLAAGPDADTLPDLALGLTRPATGTVRLFGAEPAAALRAGRVGAMPRNAGPMPGVSVPHLLKAVSALTPRALPLDDLVRQAGIGALLPYPVDVLDAPARNRLGFALALAGDADLLILHDPAGPLDDAARAAFWPLVRAQRDAGRAVLVTAPQATPADLFDRVLVVDRGTLLADADPAELLAGTGLRVVTCAAPGLSAVRAAGLPGVVEAIGEPDGYRLLTTDTDRTVAALHEGGYTVSRLGLAPLDLDEACRRLTKAARPGGRKAEPPVPVGAGASISGSGDTTSITANGKEAAR